MSFTVTRYILYSDYSLVTFSVVMFRVGRVELGRKFTSGWLWNRDMMPLINPDQIDNIEGGLEETCVNDLSENWDSHGGDYARYCLLGWDTATGFPHGSTLAGGCTSMKIHY
jgi:hypothetical protein